MWFGITYIPADERDDGGLDPLATVLVYQRERLFTVGGTPDSLAEVLDLLRLAAYDSALALPRCRSCGHGLDVPDVDGLEAACGSA